MPVGHELNYRELLERLRRRLLETGGRNRLVNFPLESAPRGQSLRIVHDSPDDVFNRLVIGEQAFRFLPRDTESTDRDERDRERCLQTDTSAERLEGVLEEIRRQSRRSLEEMGVNTLFLAMGFLRWVDSDHSDQARYAPLLLIPVALTRPWIRNRQVHELSHLGEEIQENRSLARLLEEQFNQGLPELEDGMRPEAYFRAIREQVASARDGWEVKPHSVLGLFTFQKQVMWEDLDPGKWMDASGRPANEKIRQLFHGAEGPTLPEIPEDEAEEGDRELLLALDADSSQEEALREIQRDRDLVIQGPPGTGKSQTIVNAIVSAIASGKSVLFLSEKQAALEVVNDRLKQLGLEPLILKLHSRNATPSGLIHQLPDDLAHHFDEPARELDRVRRELEDHRRHLRDYLDALGQRVGPLQLPLQDIFGRVVDHRARGIIPLPEAPLPGEMSHQTFNRCYYTLELLPRHVTETGPVRQHPWAGFDCPDVTENDMDEVAAALDALAADTESVSNAMEAITGLVGVPADELFPNGPRPAASRLQAELVPGEALDPELSKGLDDPQRLEAGEALLQQLWQLSGHAHKASESAATAWEEAIEPARQVVDQWAAEFESSLPETLTIGELRILSVRLAELAEIIEACVKDARALEAVGIGSGEQTQLRAYETALDQYELAAGADTPSAEELQAEWFWPTARPAFEEARAEAADLEDQQQSLEEVFVLADRPEAAELSDLRQELRPYASRPLARLWPWSRYRRELRPRLERFCRTLRLKQVLPGLENLERWETERLRFLEKTRYVEHFGAAFEGDRTDWDWLDQRLGWCQRAREMGFTCEQVRHLVAECKARQDGPTPDQAREHWERLRSQLQEGGVPGWVLAVPERDAGYLSLWGLLDRVRRWTRSLQRVAGHIGAFRVTEEAPISRLREAAVNVVEADRLTREIEGSTRFRHALGEHFQGARTPIRKLEASLSWVRACQGVGLGARARRWLYAVDAADRVRRLCDALEAWAASEERWGETRDRLTRFGSFDQNWLTLDGGPNPVLRRIRGLRESVNGLGAWAALCQAARDAREGGCAPWAEAVFNGTLPADQAAASFDLTVHERLANRMVSEIPALRHFSRQGHEATRARFAELDRQLLRLQAMAAAYRGSRRQPPDGKKSGPIGERTEMGLLRHEKSLQRHRRPIRTLVDRAGRALTALKPCFMMSPLSVAQFIPQNAVSFDLVIMDEASQIKPEDALGAVARAKQIVVVGDDRQMPPSTFFERLGQGVDEGEEEEETLDEGTESILEWANRAYQRERTLRWHYRSRVASLIAFSNERFYDGELVLFPSAVGRSHGLGIRYHFVENSTFTNRISATEAQRVAEAVVDHALSGSDESVGVGTFNKPQAEAIEDRLNELYRNDSRTRAALDRLYNAEEPLFVKNLENLQGDERDVIFLSYTYGPDPAAERVYQRFFPINTAKGWRRFNVMITRAKKRIEIYTSIHPEQIRPGGEADDERNRGVTAMRDYLRYARDGELPESGRPSGRDPDSPFEKAVARVIRDLGYPVDAQVGVAGYFVDLAIPHPTLPDEYVLGIECDGAAYHTAGSDRDRDRLREEILESRGWRLHRIWSTDWFRNQRTETERLRQAIEEAIQGPNTTSRIRGGSPPMEESRMP